MSTADEMTEEYLDDVALLVYSQDAPAGDEPGHAEMYFACRQWVRATQTEDRREKARLLMLARVAAGQARDRLRKAVGL